MKVTLLFVLISIALAVYGLLIPHSDSTSFWAGWAIFVFFWVAGTGVTSAKGWPK